MRSEPEQALLVAVELHDPNKIRVALQSGLDARQPIDGRTPIDWLTEMYTRSPRFSQCLAVMIEEGGEVGHPALEAVLLDDPAWIESCVRSNPQVLHNRLTRVCAYTPLDDATLLHVAAEFGLTRSAAKLLELGAEVDARAGLNAQGLGGQTPLFHTVNSNRNHCEPVMRLLLDAGAGVDARVDGLVWGKGLEWETVLFDLTPVSYSLMGLLPQFHRDERAIYENVATLLHAAGRRVPVWKNIPNRYLRRP
ncbi:MAG: ankyrin repeat domain-containing protein [Phycisphaera sp.]|nr:ankyrin repeat domain-containing protein [Phycisphaera sp.]